MGTQLGRCWSDTGWRTMSPRWRGPDSLQAPPEAGAGGGSPLSSRAHAQAHVGVTFQLAGEKRRAPALALLINL